MCPMKRKISLLCCCISLCLLTGCWDIVQVENRLFVLLLGIDKVEDEELDITYAVPDVTEYKEKPKDAFRILNTKAKTLPMAKSNINTEFSRELFLGHTKAVLLGKKVVEDKAAFQKVIEALMRDNELEKNVYLLTMKTPIEELSQVKPVFNILLSSYIEGVSDNSEITAKIFKTTLEETVAKMVENKGNFLLPCAEIVEEKLTIEGVAIIKDYTLLDYLNKEQTEDIAWLRGTAKAGVIDNFVYHSFKSKIKLEKIENGKAYLNIEMLAKGGISGEYTDLTKLEKEYAKIIEDRCSTMINELQNVYDCDVIGINDYMKKFHPKQYEEQMEFVITPKVVVKISDVGIME